MSKREALIAVLVAFAVGVIGAGVMGSGIAQSLASAGYQTVCFDISTDAIEAARDSVLSGHYGLSRAVDLGKLSRDEADAAYARLEFTDDLERACAAGLVVECVPERLDLKIQTFRDLDRRAPEGAILASNSSGFSIPSNTAKWVLPQLLNQGRVRRGRIGIAGQDRPLERRVVRALDLGTEVGVEVLSVEAGGPAAMAGVREGDLVVGLNDQPVKGIDDLQRFLAEWPLKNALALEVLRGNETVRIQVAPVEASG